MKRLTIPAGDKDQLVTIERRAAGLDARGQASGTWSAVASNVWASVRPLRGRELFAAAQMQAAADMMISIDYIAGVLPSDRVVWNGAPYRITGQPIDVDGQHHTLELPCTTWTADGV